jgi:hypothetical protein
MVYSQDGEAVMAMLEEAREELSSGPGRNLGATFRRVGWFGFWVQICVAVVPILISAVIFAVVRGFTLPGARMPILGWLSLLSILILAFTTFWSWRYRGIGQRLGTEAPDIKALSRTVWTGIAASAVGILFSLVVMLAEIIFLLVVFLEAPQGGAPVFQTVDGAGPAWISAIDVLSLLVLILTAAAEIVTLLLALWLLSRLTSATVSKAVLQPEPPEA